MVSHLLWWRHNLVSSASPLENEKKQMHCGGIPVLTRPVANLSDMTEIYESIYFCWTHFLRKYRHRNDTI